MFFVKKLAYGVMCFAAMAAVVDAQAASASLYVQDGLVACWDGIENAGKGVHDPAATVWKDLVGGYEFSLTGVTVNDDRMTFAGSSSSYGVLTSADTISTFVAAKDGTMEIVYRSDTGSGSQVFLQAPATSGIACGIWYYSNASLMMYLSSVSQNNKSGFNFMSGSTTNSVSVRYTSCVPVSSFANGVERSASSTAKSYWTYPNDDDKAYVGNRANKSGNFVGSIYCIRIYNRQLSDAEIAANYKVDQKRFFSSLMNPLSMCRPCQRT